jgi:hypothetical protein
MNDYAYVTWNARCLSGSHGIRRCWSERYTVVGRPNAVLRMLSPEIILPTQNRLAFDQKANRQTFAQGRRIIVR